MSSDSKQSSQGGQGSSPVPVTFLTQLPRLASYSPPPEPQPSTDVKSAPATTTTGSANSGHNESVLRRLKLNSMKWFGRVEIKEWSGDYLPLVAALIDNTSLQCITLALYVWWKIAV